MISFQAFSDELLKIAKKSDDWKKWDQDKGRIYDPGVTAHEAGHVKLHGSVPGMTAARIAGGLVATLGPAAYLTAQISRGKSARALPMAAMIGGGFAPILADEAYASVKGYKSLEESGKYSKEELKQMRNKLLAAGGTYAAVPASGLATLALVDRAAKKGSRAAAIGAFVGVPLATAAAGVILQQKMKEGKGPAVSAREAKRVAQKIAPGVDVYATDTPIPQGSFAMPKTPKWMHESQMETMKAFLKNKKDRKRLVEKGGIVIAPIRDTPRGERVR